MHTYQKSLFFVKKKKEREWVSERERRNKSKFTTKPKEITVL